jgi:hypothetical protein
MNKKPSVFPTQKDNLTKEEYNAQTIAVSKEVYEAAASSDELTDEYKETLKKMQNRNAYQMSLRDKQLKINHADILKYQQQLADAENKSQIQLPPKVVVPDRVEYTPYVPQGTITGPATKIVNNKQYIDDLSAPQFNAPHDILPLPSEGKIYKHKKKSVRVAFMTTTDESILTSPNLLQSGKFLEVLMNRKLLESNMRYQDLHIGDRNAIMIWLRATSYGSDYPVIVNDEIGEPFETIIDLSKLKTKKLGAEPDDDGYFDFQFKLCKSYIKFKLLTVKDIDELDIRNAADATNEFFLNKSSNYMLQMQIVNVDGYSDQNYINDFIDNLRIGDATDFRKYAESIESGVDLNLVIGTPRGGSIKTFLPLNTKFFWPDLGI